ncbi:MAG TPA: WecB/TagA/CpsF family glycosyltransferase [Caulobacteraceae bacterium]|nr:WecB/TagA/CpsF family glycosyltransferase [Caulobacteraceae bacterium]
MVDRVQLLGGPVDLVSRGGVLRFIGGAVAAGRKAIIGNQNFHSLYLSRDNASLASFFDAADLIEIDSTPLLFWANLVGMGLTRQHRSTYLDWRDDFWRLASRNRWRVFCLGATTAVNAVAVARLSAQWPGAVIAGHDGYFDQRRESAENAEIVSAINEFRPDVLFVGMGMPLQETWIVENYAALASGVVLSVGAAFDYEAGAQSPAPRIYGELGLEWLYRLAREPRRLFRRYLIEPWFLVAPALDDVKLWLRGSPPSRRPRVVWRYTPGSSEVTTPARRELSARDLQKVA